MEAIDDEVVWLSIEEPEPRRRRYGLYALVAVGFVICLGAGVAVVMKAAAVIAERSRPITVTRPLSTKEVYAESFRIFSEYDGAVLPEDEEYARLERVLNTIGECAANDDDDGFARLVDKRRLHRLLEEKGAYRGLSVLDKAAARREINASLDVDTYWCNPKIVSVSAPSDDPETRIVYVVSGPANGEGFDSETRFLFGRDGESWQAYDWRRLDLGLAESDFFMLWVQTIVSSAENRFSQWLQAVQTSDAASAEGEIEQSQQALREAEQVMPQGPLHDYCQLLTGYRWQSVGSNDDTQRCLQKVKHPELYAGVYYGLSNCVKDKSPEEALTHAEAYAALVGPTPDCCRQQAKLLDELGRQGAARFMWKEVLRSDPANTWALARTMQTYSAEEKGKIFALLDRAPDPVASASELVGWLPDEDYAGLEILVNFLSQRSPGSAATHAAVGTLQRADGRFSEATSSFFKAIQSDEDPDAHLGDYLDAAALAGDLLKAFDALPDQAAAFEQLAYDRDEGNFEISTSDFRELVRRRFKESPEDLGMVYRWAEVLKETDRTAEAEALLRGAIKRTAGADQEEDAYVSRTDLTASLARLLYRDERWREAYPDIDEGVETFETLVQLASDDRRPEILQELITRGRQRDLPKASLAFAEGELALLEERQADAAARFRVAAESTEDYRQWNYQRSCRIASVEAGLWRAYYEAADDRSEAFDELSDLLIERADWKTLEELHLAHADHPSAASDIALSRADAAWEKEDDRSFLQHADALDQNALDALPYYSQQTLARRKRLAFLREGRYGEALSQAQEQGSQAAIAAIHATQGNTRLAVATARRVALEDPSLWGVYQHDFAGRAFLGPNYAELHRDFPVTSPYGGVVTMAVFHSVDGAPLRSSDLREAIERLPREQRGEITRLLTIGPRLRSAAAMSVGDAVIWVATGADVPYDAYRARNQREPLADVVNRSGGWTAIGLAGWNDKARDRAAPTARRLAAHLFEGRAGVVRIQPVGEYVAANAYAADDKVLAWREGDDLEQFIDQRIRLEYTNAADPLPCERHFRDSLFAAFHRTETDADSRLLIAAEPPGARGFGATWMEVETVERGRGSLDFSGPLRADSPLLTDLRSGMNIQVPMRQVVAWRWDRASSEPTLRCSE